MSIYNTPGVYVEEVASFPPSVAPVSTAIPAFIGYTEKADSSLLNKPVRITSFLEFKKTFGGPQPGDYKFTVSEDGVQYDEGSSNLPTKLLYHHLDFYFKNGGGACYIVSVGNHSASATLVHFTDALNVLSKEDEPTLYVFPDALALGTDYYQLVIASLKECHKLGDRFTIIDMPDSDTQEEFRNKAVAPAHNLRYGAAYSPYLETTLGYAWTDQQVSVDLATERTAVYHTDEGGNGLLIKYKGATSANPVVSISKDASVSATTVAVNGNLLTITLKGDSISTATVLDKWGSLGSKGNFEVLQDGDGTATVNAGVSEASLVFATDSGNASLLANIKDIHTATYAAIESKLNSMRIDLPPSAAIAGVYASVDRDRGVWKAPANIPLAAVIQPTKKITHDEQASLNIDPTTGKSINAIRSFTGKGTLVWGARTLEGNSNDWRYISVRRLFNMVEESLKKATDFAVFEANDANTWLKVKGMSESFLFGLYEQGAFAGSEPSKAYYVNVGLGTTMTPQDVLEGRMIVEIGIAPVRPAEFIILRFSQKIQE